MAEVVKKSLDKRRIAGLDGLRALAVMAVILYHVFPSIVPGGYVGVDIFFVISGFLITTLLLKEHQDTTKIALMDFYKRRLRRLLPALLLVIGIVSSVALLVRGDVLVGLSRQIVGALVFCNNWLEIAAGTNYFDATSLHLFTNFWSLAVEEQFYLVWPFVVLGLVSVPLFARRRWMGTFVSMTLAVISAVLMARLFDGQNATRVYYGTDTHLFGLMIGAALAFWEYARTVNIPNRRMYLHVPFQLEVAGRELPLQAVGMAALTGLVVIFAGMTLELGFSYRGGLVLASGLAALVIMATVSRRGLLQKFFTLSLLEWIGQRSYGIYLWHWPIFVLLYMAVPRTLDWAVACLTVVLTVAISALSYHYIEQPVRRNGIRSTLHRGVHRQVVALDGVRSWRLRPHPLLLGAVLLLALTTAAVVTAPSKTRAEAQVIAGERAIQASQAAAKHTPLKPAPRRAITGNDITFVGDSVTLAAAPALTTEYPGILIDAQVSRSLHRGGLEDIQNLQAAGNLRQVVIVALGTNGYYGTDGLDTLMAVLKGHDVIFVTAHAPVEWVAGNNQDVHSVAARYPNVHVAEWDQVISAQPELLGPDNIHPGPTGGRLYADCIKTAIAAIK